MPVPSPARRRIAPLAMGGAPRPVGVLKGVELIGTFHGSGYKAPTELVRRADGRWVRLPPLLYAVAQALQGQQCHAADHDSRRLFAAIADAVGKQAGLALNAEHIAYLLDRKLAPLGVTTYADGTCPELAPSTPFLALRVRRALLSARVTWVLGGTLAWLFQPLVLLVAVVAMVGAETWVLATQDLATAMIRTLLDPAGILLVVALGIASTVFHECGHSAACRYGGVAPGDMGCGLYLAWPVFYTDVTNSYRLGRPGRLRTDLGGVYFNGLFLIVLVSFYAATGYAPLLIAVLAVNTEVVQQLLPTMRFDGYYIAADIAGIPDLFKYIGPILARTVLRRSADPKLAAIKQWPQVVVTAWVLVTVPILALQLGFVVWNLPTAFRTAWGAASDLVKRAVVGDQPLLDTAASAMQTLPLLLSLAGIVLVLAQLARSALRRTRHHASGRRGERGP